jgi:carbonic anhydrase
MTRLTARRCFLVVANEIMGEEPGSVFVVRNVANLVVSTDVNLMSALQYAVSVLKESAD